MKEYPKDKYLETAGSFPVTIEAVSDTPTKNGKERLSVKYKVASGEHAGEVIWGSVFNPKVAGRLFKCAGADAGYLRNLPTKDVALEHLKGRALTVHVVQNGKWFNVDTVDAMSEEETTALPAIEEEVPF